ncbi:MAG: carboxypeptidase-like regulatory domain-containing protein [Tangfeifania sp.]
MRKEIFTGLILIVATAFSSLAQNDDPLADPILIRLKAQIISAEDSSGVPYVNIVNNRTHSGTITNAEGYFTLDMLNIDSLVISSVGFEKKVLKVPLNYNGQEVLTYVMNPRNYPVGEVEVKGKSPGMDLGVGTGKPVNIDPELRGDAFNEKPPIIAALFNPISYWQYYLSKSERRKRNVREAMAIERNWELHSKNYNKQVVMKLTGLDEAKADSFMIWFNAQNVLPYTATEYEVRASITYYFDQYKKQRK